jgi:exopolysaccharide biosynthesis polyprenyl glycosylphosphotransferase
MNRNKLRLKYLLYDIISAFIVWVLFMLFRRTVNDAQLFENVRIFIPNYNFLSILFVYPFVCAFFHYISGFYLKPDQQSKTGYILTTFTSSALISIVIFFVLLLDDILVSYQYYYYSLLVLFILMFSITLIFRSLIISDINNRFKTKKWTINTLIIGVGKNASKIASELEKNSYKNTLCGFVSVDNTTFTVPKDSIIGNFSQIEQLITQNAIEEVIIALDDPDELKLFNYINTLYKFNIDIKFTPRLHEILTGSARIGSVGLNPLVSLTDIHMPDWQIATKRVFDIAFSTLMLILLLPVFLYFAIAIKFDSKGPVFYLQERIGRYGKAFNILKFRTMHQNAENGTPKLSSATDERVTRIGKILRKYRIDELPQFWNILMGEMSVVGPRPERKYYINQIIEDAPYYCLLYKIRPGLTSWGPIKIGYSDTIEKMVERLNYDIIYMEDMSLLNDLQIMILTIEILFKGKGV